MNFVLLVVGTSRGRMTSDIYHEWCVDVLDYSLSAMLPRPTRSQMLCAYPIHRTVEGDGNAAIGYCLRWWRFLRRSHRTIALLHPLFLTTKSTQQLNFWQIVIRLDVFGQKLFQMVTLAK